MKTYDFDKQLNYSSSLDPVILGLLKTKYKALNAYKAHPINDRKGIDFFVEINGGTKNVDAKIRKEDLCANKEDEEEKDYGLETWSIMEKKIIGWTLDDTKLTDYILFYYEDTQRNWLVDFRKLKAVFKIHQDEWWDNYFVNEQPNRTYTSECIFVPKKIIKQAIKEYEDEERILRV